MELRYRMSRGCYYIPQYMSDTGWKDFDRELLEKKNKLKEIAWMLSKIQQMDYLSKDNIVLFAEEILVMAFLGAAKSYFSEQYKDFKI